MKEKRVLPADVYDTLELSALAYGGIGAGRYFDANLGVPVCVVGHARAAVRRTRGTLLNPVEAALGDVAIETHANDRAVEAINARKGEALAERVPFNEWCAELGVERGK